MSIYLFSNFLYLSVVVAFSNAKPFRKPFYTNKWFLLNIVVYWIFDLAIVCINSSEFWVENKIDVIILFIDS